MRLAGKWILDGEFLNQNMYTLAHRILPRLAIVDGYVGMEGNGPEQGGDVNHRVVVAGHDAVAVDRICLELMNIDPEDVPMLQWCTAAGLGQSDEKKILILGAKVDDHVNRYKLPDNIDDQLRWIRNTVVGQGHPYRPSPYLRVENPITPFRYRATATLGLSTPLPDILSLSPWCPKRSTIEDTLGFLTSLRDPRIIVLNNLQQDDV